MITEIKKNVTISIATAVIIGGMTLFYNAIHNELKEYSELKKSLPQLQELNKVRFEMEEEYRNHKSSVTKDLETIKQKQKRDSTFIYWNHYYVKRWVDAGH